MAKKETRAGCRISRARAVLAGGEESHRPIHDQETLGDLVEGADLDVTLQALVVGDHSQVVACCVLVQRAYTAAPGQHPLFTREARITQAHGGASSGHDGEQFLAGVVHGPADGFVDLVESSQQADARNLRNRLRRPFED